MPYPSNNRQNYRMRANTVPPPTKNPYLSRQELRKKALEYNAGQQSTHDQANGNRSNEMQPQTNNMNQRMAPQNMLQNANGSNSNNVPPLPTETINMAPTDNDWASPTTRSWMNSQPAAPSAPVPEEMTRERITPRTNPYDDNRSFPWMNPRGDQRLSPGTSRGLDTPPAWMRRNASDNSDSNMTGSQNYNTQNNDPLEFLPRTDRENQ